MRKVKSNQAGFTLIELVVVIVILGILAATAIPRFVNLSDEAGAAAASGVAGAIASGSAVNYAAIVAGQAGQPVTSCSDTQLEAIVSGVDLVAAAPANGNQYQITDPATTCTAAGEAIQCTVTGVAGSATASVICSAAN